MSPKQKKRVVKDAAERGLCSLRRACVYLSLSWSTFSYRPKQANKKAQRLAERIVTLSWEHPRYGYRRIRALLVKEGWTTSRKFVQAVRRSEGLQVKPPKKRRHRQGISTGPPTKATGRNHVWSWDFVHDRTDNGGPLKMMTLIDEYTRKCLDIRVARRLTSADVLSVLSEAIEEEGVPSYIRSDNGSEFIAHQVERWLREKDFKAIYIDAFKDSLQYGVRFPVFQPYHNGVLSQLHRPGTPFSQRISHPRLRPSALAFLLLAIPRVKGDRH